MRNRDPTKIRRYAPLYPPVPVPDRDWCEEPTVGICINEDWAQLIVGLLEVLRCVDLWDTTNPRHIDVARSVQSLMDAINDPNLCGDSVCDTIADCISSSPSTQQALAVTLNANFTLPLTGGAPNNPLPVDVTATNMLPDIYECDNNHAFATARAIVEAIGDTALGVLEAYELITNPAEIAEEVAGIIPILGQIVAVGIKVLNWMQDNLIELYRAAWNNVTRDIIACELYCVILENPNCSISFDQVWDVYMSLYTGGVPSRDDGAEVWFLWLIEQALLPGVFAVKAGGVLGLICMLYGSKFGGFGLGVRSLELVIALAADETSDDWQFLCKDCPDRWYADWDFILVDGNWTVVDGFNHLTVGEWPGANGWGSTFDFTVTGIGIGLPVGVDTVLEQFDVEMDLSKGTGTDRTDNAKAVYPGGLQEDVVNLQKDTSAFFPNGLQTWKWGGSHPLVSTDWLVVKVYSGLDYTEPYEEKGSVDFLSIHMEGTGTAPVWANPPVP